MKVSQIKLGQWIAIYGLGGLGFREDVDPDSFGPFQQRSGI
ncbi:hypothetical protein KCQ_00455 [Pectobacterium atrosepticum ICMP 1526]|nr:hypothetical protein KCQ_00455 [Pectobacterium atrosepticum ICMP 1526]